MAPSRFFNKLPRGKVYLEPRRVLHDWGRNGLADALERGDAVATFERAFAATFGTRNAIAMPMARTSFYYLLKALRLPPGSEVIMPPLNIADMVNMILLADLKPVFVDLGERTGNLDPTKLQAALTSRTKVILVTHIAGLPSDMDPIRKFAREHGLTVMEDGSQAIGARYDGENVGLLGDAGFFSLSTLKPVSTFFGGIITTNNDILAETVRSMIAHQQAPRRAVMIEPVLREFLLDLALRPLAFSAGMYYLIGLANRLDPRLIDKIQRGNQNFVWTTNPRPSRRTRLPQDFDSRFTDFQARAGLGYLPGFWEETGRRQALGELLIKLLSTRHHHHLPVIPDKAEPVFWRFPFWPSDPRAFRRSLHDRYVDSTRTNLVLCSRDEAFSPWKTTLPQAETFADEMVFLPIHHDMTEEDMAWIAEAVNDATPSARRPNSARGGTS